MSNPLMKCGHIANAQTLTGQPCCVICECYEVNTETLVIDVSNRQMKCSQCGHIEKSNTNAAFFEYCPTYEFDRYYCGCYGWD